MAWLVIEIAKASGEMVRAFMAVCMDLTPVGGHLSPVDAASTCVGGRFNRCRNGLRQMLTRLHWRSQRLG